MDDANQAIFKSGRECTSNPLTREISTVTLFTMNSTPPTYFLIDDHLLILEGLKKYLSTEFPEWECLGHALSNSEALSEIADQNPSVIFIDHQMGAYTGIDFIKSFKNPLATPSFVLISQIESKTVLKEYLQLGVLGFVSKKDSQDEIKKAVEHISMTGEVYFSPTFKKIIQSFSSVDMLTPREIDVIQLIARGLTNKEAAKELSCSEFTIKTHKSNIMRKLKMVNSIEICNWALRNKLI